MPDGAWPYIIVAVAVVLLGVIAAVASRVAWRRQVQRFIQGVLGHRDAIRLAVRSTQAIIDRLAGGNVQDVIAFAAPGSDERSALAEIGRGMAIEAQELSEMALPRRLWKLADHLSAAAGSLASQATAAGDAVGEAALDALAALDLDQARISLDAAEGEVLLVSARYGLIERRSRKRTDT